MTGRVRLLAVLALVALAGTAVVASWPGGTVERRPAVVWVRVPADGGGDADADVVGSPGGREVRGRWRLGASPAAANAANDDDGRVDASLVWFPSPSLPERIGIETRTYCFQPVWRATGRRTRDDDGDEWTAFVRLPVFDFPGDDDVAGGDLRPVGTWQVDVGGKATETWTLAADGGATVNGESAVWLLVDGALYVQAGDEREFLPWQADATVLDDDGRAFDGVRLNGDVRIRGRKTGE